MGKKYYGLYDLIHQDENAMSYYSQLPYFVKQVVGYRANDITSFEILRYYGENLAQISENQL